MLVTSGLILLTVGVFLLSLTDTLRGNLFLSHKAQF